MTDTITTTAEVPQWGTFELCAPGPAGDSWIDVDLVATFTNGSRRIQAQGFAAGADDLRVRFSPPATGTWHYTARRGDEILIEGSLECVPGASSGPVQVRGTGFVYADGSSYTPFGTTLYAWTHQSEALRAETLRSIAASPFNKVRMCVFPKGMAYNTTEPVAFPFEREADGTWNVHRPNPAYWDALDEHIDALDRLGVEADLILFHPYDSGPAGPWGLATLSTEDCLSYLRYVVRRLAAHRNVWWSLANEYDMMFDRDPAEWVAFGELVANEDPSGHLLSCHNWIRLFDFDLPWITHCSIQSSQVHRVSHWRSRYQKPVIVDELGYEGDLVQDWGQLSGFELVHRMWCVIVAGGYATHGETFYDPDEVIWWAKGGHLRGDAPARIRFLRDLVERLGGSVDPVPQRDIVDPNGLDGGFARKLLHAIDTADPFVRAHIQATNTVYEAATVDGSRIRYLGRSRQSAVEWDLPDGKFTIEIIDVWNMTRRTVIAEARGATRIPLPATEGTALLATRLG